MSKLSNVFTQYRGLSRTAYVLFFGKMITNMGAFIFPMLSIILARKFGYSVTEIALVMIIVGVLYLPMTFIGGKLADRYNRKKLIIVFDVLSVVFFITCAFFQPGIYMMICFVLAGMFANLEGPAYEALIADTTLPSEREKVYSLSYLGHNLGYSIGAVIGGLLVENYLSFAFIFDGLTTLISTILIVSMVKVVKLENIAEEEINEYEDHEDEDKSTLAILKERKSVLVQILTFFLIAFIYDQWTFALPLYFTELYGENGSALYGYISGFNGVVVIMFTPIITSVLSQMKELQKVILGVGLYAFSFLIITGNPAYYVFFIMIFMFTIGEIINMLGQSPFISRRVPASHRGRVNSYVFIGFFLGSLVGKGVIGWLIENYSYDVGFYVLAITGAVTLVIVGLNMKLDQKIFPKLYKKDVMRLVEESE